ncbi:hypothetical protein HU200_046835 [Digitaria exilis]|uniref:Protein ENHANCED DISEASE RESISTANCE 2 C-terminal domain-containing protein n=1 Tax=Digitaria exilis TaxID=1010633 RepID=A0A835AVB5_9POAL|nr:hypothetical protein HU200_046835 [Digitaria exilis]
MPNMLGSSASRREARSGELPKAATIALRDAATKAIDLAKTAAAREATAAAVRHEGWMVRYGRRKIGRSFFHTRYFVLDSKLLAYYKKKPKDNMMGAYEIEDAMAWKKKIELVIDQQQDSMTAKNRKAFASMDFDMDLGGQFAFSDHDSAAEDDEERPTLTRRTTIGNGKKLQQSYEGCWCNGRPRTQILNCVAGLREYFSQTDELHITPRIPVMETMVDADSEPKSRKLQEVDSKTKPVDPRQADNKNMGMIDEESDEDDEYQVAEADLEIPAASYLMQLAAIDWFKDTKRMDNVARQKGCVAQVAAEKGMHTFAVNIQIPGSTHYSLVMYFVTSSLKKGSLLQRFFDGDDEFRNSRLKLIPSVPKVLYVRGPGYLEVDVDIGSSAVANGVLGLVFGVVTTLVVDMAFLIQANTYEELPEQVIGAARLAHVEPATAVVPDLSDNTRADKNGGDASSEDDLSKKIN